MQHSEQDFIERRRKGIGGTDISAILGLNPYKTPLDIFNDKKGLSRPVEMNSRMRWGNRLEPIVLDEYESLHRLEVIRPDNTTFYHRDHEFCIAHPDALVVSNGKVEKIIEVKTTAKYSELSYGTIPNHYHLQCQWYMEVLDVDLADLVVLIGGSEYQEYTIERDKDLGIKLIKETCKFWKSLEDNIPPEPSTINEIKNNWPDGTSSCSTIACDSDMKEIEAYKAALEEKKEIEEKINSHKFQLLSILTSRNAEIITDSEGNTLISAKEQTTRRIDTQRLREENPKLADEYTNKVTSRVLRTYKRNGDRK